MDNAMVNESIFTNFKRELQTLNYAELNYLISDIMLEIKKRSYNEGMVKGMTSFGSKEDSAPVESEKAPQQLRDEIVEKAKRDVAELTEKTYKEFKFKAVKDYGHMKTEFVVNREKRTVVALLRGRYYKTIAKNGILRGIAKCDPSDCFNGHIGKAIALRRALGLEVPSEYLNAPQPTEVREGDIVSFYYRDGSYAGNHTVTKTFDSDGILRTYDKNGQYAVFESEYGDKIIDDSRDYPSGGICNGEG